MNYKLIGSLFVIAMIAVAAIVGAYFYWDSQIRWRPTTITKHQNEIAQILERSGWVSPGNSGPKLYMVSFRSCPDCIVFQQQAFPRLQAANVDTREIMVAQADTNGLARSTPVERATVAELWVNRRWPLLQAWYEAPVDAWKAPGIPAADGDVARTAVVEASRKMVDDLTPLLKDNGVNFAYPLMIWWTKSGEMHACACETIKAQSYVLQELGA